MNRRILLLLTDLEIGGTPTVVREIARRLHDPPRVSMHVACLGKRGPVADAIEKSGIGVTPLNASSAADLAVFRRLTRLIHGEKFDTVFSFLVHANAAASVASFFCPGVRFLQSIQTTQPRPHWHWKLQKLLCHRADRIVVPTSSAAQVAHQRSGAAVGKIVVVPNGVDVPATRPEYRFGTPPHRVVFLGRLDPVKRLPDLLDAVKLLDGMVRLDIYGEGAERASLSKRIEQLQISSLVALRGGIDGPYQALGDAELLVLPSEAEGFGLVLIEAMAAGVPVVATNAPGIRDVVQNNVTGLLVPVGTPADLADAIRRVVTNHELGQRLAAAGWAMVRNRFTWDIAMDGYCKLLGL